MTRILLQKGAEPKDLASGFSLHRFIQQDDLETGQWSSRFAAAHAIRIILVESKR
jgi:hypothetical protein